ncbi:MAG: hypothetical protein E5Y62_21265 [Mesorhizobium sp.]|nr:MAG: hypothetical protein E5Y62_21265 [Mesorhizobium sp.]
MSSAYLRCDATAKSPPSAISYKPTRLRHPSLGRSKERSDAAQTLGSMPLHQPKIATVVTNRTGAGVQARRNLLYCQ